MAARFEQKLNAIFVIGSREGQPTVLPQRNVVFFLESERVRVKLERFLLVIDEHRCEVDFQRLPLLNLLA